MELGEAVQQLLRHKRLLDFAAEKSHLNEACQWRRRLRTMQTGVWQDVHAPAAVSVSFPDALYAKLERCLGARCREFCAISNEIPSWAFLRGDKSSLLQRLEEIGHHAYECDQAKDCIRVDTAIGTAARGLIPLSQVPSYLCGEWEFQDESSQLVADLVQCSPTDTVIDLCCGAGGKALAVFSRLGSGQLILHDPRSSAVKRAMQRFRRALKGAELCPNHLYFETDRSVLSSWEGRAHWVLIDAPCTNTGSLRHHPECKYRLFEEDDGSCLQLLETQRQLLATAKTLLRSGGFVVYSTCSVLPEENEEQIEFAEAALGFAVLKAEGFLPKTRSRDGYFAAVLQNERLVELILQ